MCKKIAYLTCLVLLIGSVGNAADVHWKGGGGNNLWSTPANWEFNRVPNTGDNVFIDPPAANAPNGPVIQDGIDAKINGLSCEVAGEPTMTMTGGTLEMMDYVWWGDGDNSHGTFNMSGGTITVGNEFELGWGGGSGTWIMTDGSVTVGELVLPTATGKEGELFLHGGVFNVGSGGIRMTDVGMIDVGNGKLILEGDLVSTIQGFIDSGLISAYGGGGRILLDYDITSPGKTTLAAAWTGVAYNPNPADGSYHTDTWANLSWLPDEAAASHDVYFGVDYDEVNNGTGDTFRGNQVEPFFVVGFPGFPYPEGLVPGTTYYWRIDEVEADGTKHKGDVWSFTVPPKTAYNPDPADGAESVDPNVALAWTAGFGAKLHTVYFGENYDEVNNATGGSPQGITNYTPGPLETERVYYWRVDEFDAVTTHKGQVWAFSTPGAAGAPQPANGAADVQMTAKLSWSPAASAVSHDIYFGTDKDAVRNATMTSPEFKGNKASGSESYDPGKLAWHSDYYWRVDAVYSTGTVKGLIWSFTTADFISVDDFESYNDIDPPDPGSNRIFESWIDGFGTTANGALVGNEMPPYAERIIVHNGAQAMPYSYDNNLKYSEATLTLTYPHDWTEEGVTELSLWFHGGPTNASEQMYIALNGTAAVYHDNPSATQAAEWTEWIIPLESVADQGIDLSNVNAISIGLGDKNNLKAGGSGKMYFDDIRLHRPGQSGLEPVAIENFSFELPGTEKQKGFDNVPGWNTDGPCADSGVETGYTPTDGDWTAYLMSGDPSVWQLTDRTIVEGVVFELRVDARITWAATALQMSLYYDDNGTRVSLVSSDVTLTDAMQEYTLSFSAKDLPESAGHKIGIEFSNASSGETWIGLDNVRVEVSGQ